MDFDEPEGTTKPTNKPTTVYQKNEKGAKPGLEKIRIVKFKSSFFQINFLSKIVASFEMNCGKASVLKMNVFDSQLAFILSLTAMILSFALNVCQCVKKTNSTSNTDHENIVRQDDIETNSNTMPENSTPLLVPQLMQSTDFRNYFPERNKYESKFSNFSQTDENKGILLV